MQEPTHPFAAELARGDQQTITNLLRDHVVDQHGRCAGCAMDDRLRKRWPCVLRKAAEQARDLRHAAEQARGVVHIPRQRRAG